MEKQTAAESMEERLSTLLPLKDGLTIVDYLAKRTSIVEQAKIMEKEQRIKAQIEAVRAVDTYEIKQMLSYYEQQLKEEDESKNDIKA